MSELLRKQMKFSRMAPRLLLHIEIMGYDCTLGFTERCMNCPVGIANSLHHKKLAIDINLFKDGVYLRDTASYEFLGVYWEAMGGTWGGRFGDGNHFSIEHEGVR